MEKRTKEIKIRLTGRELLLERCEQSQLASWLPTKEITRAHSARRAETPRSNPSDHVKRTTPHLPAIFGSEDYFSFKILQTNTQDRATAGELQIHRN